ncbi:acetyltransferase [Paraburkholderia phymatum]|uniref:Acetyltransferase n=1 Tax=Paraburkholderia phymatum TaxID=148447 RepID=A0ACC6TVB2_9BURK
MTDEIIVVGAGGHAKVCIEILHEMGETVAYCVGDANASDQCVGVPVLKGDENLVDLHARGYRRVFVAIGSNRLRNRLAAYATELGFTLTNAVHPKAIISQTVKFGEGVAVMAGAVINAESVIDSLAIVNTGATIDHDCDIGRAVHIAPQCALAGNVTIGAFSILGVGAKVIPEKTIGEQVTVGAGGVVINDISASQTVVGVPARRLEK